MADQPKEKPETANGKSSEEPKRAAPKEDLVPKAKLDERDEIIRQLNATLKALETRQPQQPAYHPPTATPESAATDLLSTLSSELGIDTADLRPYLRIVERAFERQWGTREAVYQNVLNALADKLDAIDARTNFPDYRDFEQDIDSERRSRQERGQWLSRSEAYHIAKGRRLPDLLRAERERAQAGEVADTVSDDGGTVSKAGPSGERPAGLPSPDEIAAMSPEDREKLLDSFGEF